MNKVNITAEWIVDVFICTSKKPGSEKRFLSSDGCQTKTQKCGWV